MYKVHSTVLKEHGEHFRSYVVLDTNSEKVLCAGQKSTDHISTTSSTKNRLEGMKEGLAHATLTVDEESTIQVYDHSIPDASLILGRLSEEVNNIIGRKNLTIKFSSTTDPVDEIAAGLSRMSRVSEQELSTAVSKPDYAVANPVRLYADGSYKDESNGDTAIGYALIDDDGTLIGLGSHSIPSAISSLEAEYEALRAGVNKASKYDQITNLTLISDNRRVATTLAEQKDPLPRNEDLVTEIKTKFTNFTTTTVDEESRDKNLLADALATYGHTSTLVGAI